MELAFAGTAAFAVPALDALHAASHRIHLVLTQPDRRSGRGLEWTPSPVKAAAERLQLPLFQPERLSAAEAVAQLRRLPVDALVVAGYGQLIPPEVLQLPRWGAVNIHPSLLPRHRGAAPVAHAILQGDRVTGVTIIQMDEHLDTGPIWAQREVAIGPADTTETLTARLAEEGATLLLETLPRLGTGARPTPQPSAGASWAPQLRKEDGRLTWSLPAVDIDRRVRAYVPWPGCWVTLSGVPAKLIKGRVTAPESVAGLKAGEVVRVSPRGIEVNTGAGVYAVEQLQLAGKRIVEAQEFARGRR